MEEFCIPSFIKKEYLHNIDINDEFFTSLKEDYYDFESWFKGKSLEGEMAYITYKEDGIGAFLLLKLEDENEDYSNFDISFEKAKRLKISTLKVADTGKNIGECFIKIIINEAIANEVEEIYFTIFEKQVELIELFIKYGFEKFAFKETLMANGELANEIVMVKRIKGFCSIKKLKRI